MNSRGSLSEFLAMLIFLFLLTTLALPFYAKSRSEARTRRCGSSLRDLWKMNEKHAPATGSAFWKALPMNSNSVHPLGLTEKSR